MAKTSPLEFFQQVKQEASKVTWTPRNELVVTTIMVFIMVTLAAVFFLLVDQILGFVIKQLLGLGG
jgi:preprotein translocase subunit SecE